MKSETEHKIILFDGVCNLCNSSVQLVIKNDSQNRFKFAALQSDSGQRLLKEFDIDTSKIDSIVLIDQNEVYIKSSAALRTARFMDGAYPLLSIFMVFPVFFRNWVYDWVAKNRYRWFGKKDQCMIPSPELKAKFL